MINLLYIDRNGTTQGALVDIMDPMFTQTMNSVNELEFKVPIDGELSTQLVTEGIIIFEGQRYIIKEIARSLDEGTINVYCYQDISLLKGRSIKSFENKNFDDKTFSSTITSALTHKGIGSSWQVIYAGSSSTAPTRTRKVSFEYSSIWEILQQCIEKWNYEVRYRTPKSGTNQIQYAQARDFGNHTGLTCFWEDLNLKDLTSTFSTEEVANRVWGFGKVDKEGHTVQLSDVSGRSTNYVDEIADSIHSHYIVGSMREYYYHDSDEDSATDLLEAALEYLEEHCAPESTYECDIMDLSRATGYGDLYDFALGDTIAIRSRHLSDAVEEELETSAGVQYFRVIKITQNLDDPEDTKIEISNKRKKTTATTAERNITGSITDTYNNAVAGSTVPISIVTPDDIQTGAVGAEEMDPDITDKLDEAYDNAEEAYNKATATETVVGNMVSKMQYILHSSKDTPPSQTSSDWQDEMPKEIGANEFLWQRTVTIKGSTTSYSDPKLCEVFQNACVFLNAVGKNNFTEIDGGKIATGSVISNSVTAENLTVTGESVFSGKSINISTTSTERQDIYLEYTSGTKKQTVLIMAGFSSISGTAYDNNTMTSSVGITALQNSAQSGASTPTYGSVSMRSASSGTGLRFQRAGQGTAGKYLWLDSSDNLTWDSKQVATTGNLNSLIVTEEVSVFGGTTASPTSITINSGTTTATTESSAFTKSGYYPIGIVGHHMQGTSFQDCNMLILKLTSQASGSTKVTYRIKNMGSSTATVKVLVNILWVKIS